MYTVWKNISYYQQNVNYRKIDNTEDDVKY